MLFHLLELVVIKKTRIIVCPRHLPHNLHLSSSRSCHPGALATFVPACRYAPGTSTPAYSLTTALHPSHVPLTAPTPLKFLISPIDGSCSAIAYIHENMVIYPFHFSGGGGGWPNRTTTADLGSHIRAPIANCGDTDCSSQRGCYLRVCA